MRRSSTEALAIINDRRSYSGGLLSAPNDVRTSGSSSRAGWIARDPRPWVETPGWGHALGPVDGQTPEAFAAAWAPELARIAERNALRVVEFRANHPESIYQAPETEAAGDTP